VRLIALFQGARAYEGVFMGKALRGGWRIGGDQLCIRLQTVLKAMQREGINIVAIHQHMTDEKPVFSSCITGPKAKLQRSRRRSNMCSTRKRA
jgi:hypothetical protein